MSKTTELFRAMYVINAHDLLTMFATKKDGYAVDYRRHDGNGPGCNKTAVWSPYEKTDPKSHWVDRGAKTFLGNRDRSRREALAWICARTKTKPEDWVPSPIDSQNVLVHKDVRARAMAALEKHQEKSIALDLTDSVGFAKTVALVLPIDHEADLTAKRAMAKHAATRSKRKLAKKP